jgi:phosphotriesterase-related protein
VTGSTHDPKPRGVIRTVTGDVDPAQLGWTLCHEHLVSDLVCYWRPDDDQELALQPLTPENAARVRRSPWANRDNLRLDDLEATVAELVAFRAAGGDAIIEVTSQGIGREPLALQLLSLRTGVRIVAGAGYYIGLSHPPGLLRRGVEDVADEMVRDLVSGIGETGIRAGVIGEIGAGTSPMGPTERLVLEAAAVAQQRTGAAIVAHPAPGPDSLWEVATVLRDAGARMDKVIMSHVDERLRGDLDAFRRLADLGCRFGFDTFGREQYFAARRRQHPSDADRIAAIVALIGAGLGDHVMVAQDICLKMELERFAGAGYGRVVRETVERLEHEGVSAADIARMLVATPARVFALDGPEVVA